MPGVILNQPRLRQCFTVEVVEPHAVFLLSEHRHFVFEGDIYPALLPLLDGHHSFASILSALGQKHSLQEMYIALNRLARQNCIVEADTTLLPQHAAFWDQFSVATGVKPELQRLQETRLTLHTLGHLEAQVLETALRQTGLRVEADGDLLVVMTDDYLRQELDAINREALAHHRPWVLLKPEGVVIWVGPLFRPGKTACWKCLEQRLRANRQVEHYIQDRSENGVRFHTTKARLPSACRAGVEFAAIEIAKSMVSDSRAGLEDRILTLDLLSLQLETHTLVQRPQCPACGQPQTTATPGPVALTSRHKRRRSLAAPRTATPEDTFKRYQHHISPITGIVTSLQKLDVDTDGMTHNYIVGHYFPMPTDDMNMLRVNQIARSGGKGTTEIQARVSALAEALERYSGICWGDEYKVQASYAALQPEAIHIRDLLLFSQNQYRHRREWNARLSSDRHYVPEALDDEAEIAWTPVWSLSHERIRYLPTAFCFYGHSDPGRFFSRCDSNGCAAGNTVEEAIVQGFLELVERDAVALWWYNRVRRPAVDVDSFELPYWNQMRRYYRNELQRDLQVLDITTDLTIPSFVAVSRRIDRAVEDILVGFGSHLEPRTALMQAVAEANQSVPALRHAAPDGSTVYRFHSREMLDWWQHATYANQPYLVPDPDAAPRTPADYPQLADDDVKADVLTCVRLAKARGLEVLVLDQTRPDVGMPVVRVVVPGLRHFWRRLGPGRLYDVPVQLGWLEQPRTEAELNPFSCFI